MEDQKIHFQPVPKILLFGCFVITSVYISWWLMPGRADNPILYNLLFFGEIYHIVSAMLFWFTIWPLRNNLKVQIGDAPISFAPSVDVFIPTAGEPIEIVEKTAQAAKDMNYPNHKIYILNDGYVANKPNWKEIETMATRLGINCITRTVSGGAKAGNINNALNQTSGEIVVIFDADMIPEKYFLESTIPYFFKSRVGFVQTPQFYSNANVNFIAGAAWEQQEFFFGPILRGKDKYNSAFICGTNVAIRRSALVGVGGMVEDNIAEDFLTSLKVHQQGWKSIYVPDVLATGLAPEDLLSYVKQQLRWSRGSLEVLFSNNPFFKSGLTFAQKLHYFNSALFYFNGLIILIDILMPLLYFYFGLRPVSSTTTSFALFFIPFLIFNMYTLFVSSNASLTFRAISFSQSSFVLQLQALFGVLTGQKMAFAVTPKQAQTGNFLKLAYPHLIYIFLIIAGAAFAYLREGLSPSLFTNLAWALFNTMLFIPFIYAAYPWKNLFVPKPKISNPIEEIAINV